MSQLGPNFERLRAWAKGRGLGVYAAQGTQQEPDNVVVVKEGPKYGRGSVLLRRTSQDSVDIAATYVLNTLERFGVEVPPRHTETRR